MVKKVARRSKRWTAFDPFETYIRDNFGVFYDAEGSTVFELSEDSGTRSDQKGLWLQSRIAVGFLNAKTRADFSAAELDHEQSIAVAKEQLDSGEFSNYQTEFHYLLFVSAKDPMGAPMDIFVPYLAIQALKEFDLALGYIVAGRHGAAGRMAIGSVYLSLATQHTHQKGGQTILQEIGRKGAAIMLANSPLQDQKRDVKKLFFQWKNESPDQYPSAAAFARDMVRSFDQINNEVVVTRWAREWLGELDPKNSTQALE